jgi:hypothetical protein
VIREWDENTFTFDLFILIADIDNLFLHPPMGGKQTEAIPDSSLGTRTSEKHETLGITTYL